MLLSELTGVKRFHKLSWSDLEKMLRRFGIKLIAGGSYGSVFTSEKWDYVIKLFTDDLEYLSFINFVVKHPDKHFPKIVKRPLKMHAFHKRGERESNYQWLVKIEKLQPIENKQLLKFIVYELEHGAEVTVRNDKAELNDTRFPHLLPDKQSAEYPDKQAAEYISYKQLFETYPWFESLCKSYAKILLAEDIQGAPDIHGGNIMQRDDGTIVIIDPVWRGSNPYSDYQAWLASETDSYAYDNDDKQVSGPEYLNKKQAQPELAIKKLTTEWDDIPF